MSRLSAALLVTGAMLLATTPFTGRAAAQSDSEVYNRIEELHGDAAGFDRPLRQLVRRCALAMQRPSPALRNIL